jgi:hypothetical protein
MISRTSIKNVLVPVVAAGLILGGATAEGWTPAKAPRWQKLTNQSAGGRFFNYDGARNFGKHSRDWPVTLIFYRFASVRKVKDIIGYNRVGDPEYEGLKKSKGAQARFDTDSGRKTSCNSRHRDTHFRVYAPGNSDPDKERLWDPTWGFYVVGTTHYDQGEGTGACGGKTHWFGLSEEAEFQVVARAREVTVGGNHLVVRQDFFQLHNYEAFRKEGDKGQHRWQNDGKASGIKIP